MPTTNPSGGPLPPILASLRANDGREASSLVIPGGGIAVPEGRWSCKAQTPGGRIARADVSDAAGGTLGHDRLCATFGDGDPMALWQPQSSGRGLVPLTSPDGSPALVHADGSPATAEWSDACPFWLTCSPHGSDPVFLASRSDRGVPTFTEVRPGDLLVPVHCKAPRSATVMAPFGLHTAWRGFLANREAEAAEDAARLLMASALDGGDDSHDEVLACAQALTRHWFMKDGAGKVREKLGRHAHASLDARMALWTLSMDRGEDRAYGEGLEELANDLDRARPWFTKSFRQVYARITIAQAVAEREGRGGGIAEAVGRVHRLAHSTFWDHERHTWSGSSPENPDPKPAR